MSYFGPTPKTVANLRCWAVHVAGGERVTPTWITGPECRRGIKKANSEWKKSSVTGRKSQAQICWA